MFMVDYRPETSELRRTASLLGAWGLGQRKCESAWGELRRRMSQLGLESEGFCNLNLACCDRLCEAFVVSLNLCAIADGICLHRLIETP